MSRKRKTIKIDDREITVKELTIKEIMGIFTDFTEMAGTGLGDFKQQIETILPLVTDISSEDIVKLAPSEAKEIYDVVKEVNAVFFEMAENLGMTKILGNLKTSIVSDFSSLVAGSLKPVT